ncbi:phage antirepressor [Lentisphaerota bacterium ZTH]|nr:phage antirepressor [Lentisphaerota bacterium]WET05801.1 phage antirepressor [Lentisphaerota bacterium ZTH]
MNNTELTMFNFEDASVRVINKGGEPWFVAKDVCNILEFTNPSDATKYLDDDERTLINNPSGQGGSKTTIINESGLYSLIMRSRKPNAKKFRKWVTGEVLPSIRKHGAYATPVTVETMIADPDYAINLLKALKDERKERAKLMPKVMHSEAICDSESLFTTTQVAKRLGIGPQTLNKFLIYKGILTKDKMPTYKFQDKVGKLFKIVVHKVNEERTAQYIKWYEAGARYIMNLFAGAPQPTI